MSREEDFLNDVFFKAPERFTKEEVLRVMKEYRNSSRHEVAASIKMHLVKHRSVCDMLEREWSDTCRGMLIAKKRIYMNFVNRLIKLI